MLLVTFETVRRHVKDGLALAREQRSDGRQQPKRRATYFTGKQAALLQGGAREIMANASRQEGVWTMTGRLERRVYATNRLVYASPSP